MKLFLLIIFSSFALAACQSTSDSPPTPEEIEFRQEVIEAMESQANREPAEFYSAEQVAEHSQPEDCWMIAHDRVYDMTQFVAEFSSDAGGQEIAENPAELCGQDATALYDEGVLSNEIAQWYVGDLIIE